MRYWSPMHGQNVLRVSAWGKDGKERYVIVNMDVGGPQRRAGREAALQAMERRDSHEPGEVKLG